MSDTAMRVNPRWYKKWVGYISVGLYGLTVGCATVPTPPMDEQGGYIDPEDAILVISDEDRVFPEALAHYATGYLLELKGQYAQALDAYRMALAADPDHMALYFRVAQNLIRRNDTDAAIGILEELQQRRPKDAQPLIWLAAAHRHARQIDQAIACLQRAKEFDPRNAAIYIQWADLLIQGGEIEEAVAVLEEGGRKADKPLDLYRILGELALRKAAMSAEMEKSQEQTEKAVDYFQMALKDEPNDPALLMALGDLYLRTRRFPEAIALFEKADSQRPGQMDIKEKLLFAYESVGQIEKAIALLEDMTRKDPTNARISFSLGALYERQGQQEKALTHYRLAAAGDQADAGIYLKLAHLQMEDHPEEAIKAIHTGLAKTPNQPRLLEMLAYVLFRQEKYGDALTAFESAERELTLAKEKSMTPNFHLYQAVAYYHEGREEEAAARLLNVWREFPEALDLFIQFVMNDSNVERAKQAIHIFAALREQEPDEPDIAITQGYLFSFLKQYPEAIAAFNDGEKMAREKDNPNVYLDARFYFWQSAALERNGDLEQAEAGFRHSLELAPDNAETYNYLAYMWAEQGTNLDEALAFIEKALTMKPDTPAFLDTRGWIYYHMGDLDQAERDIARAIDLMPDDPTLLEHLGDVYLKQGNTEKATELWERALAIDPENEKLVRKLGDHRPASLVEQAEPEMNVAPALPSPEATPN